MKRSRRREKSYINQLQYVFIICKIMFFFFFLFPKQSRGEQNKRRQSRKMMGEGAGENVRRHFK